MVIHVLSRLSFKKVLLMTAIFVALYIFIYGYIFDGFGTNTKEDKDSKP